MRKRVLHPPPQAVPLLPHGRRLFALLALVAWAVHIWAHACNALSQPTKFSILHRSSGPLPSTKKRHLLLQKMPFVLFVL